MVVVALAARIVLSIGPASRRLSRWRGTCASRAGRSCADPCSWPPSGWNDGAQGASLAASFLAQSWEAERFADVDPEEFYDFQAVRPHVRLEEGVTRKIDWPENVFYSATVPGIDRDAVILLGVEPNTRWRTFSEEVTGLPSSSASSSS